jgi:hypothetical protein
MAEYLEGSARARYAYSNLPDCLLGCLLEFPTHCTLHMSPHYSELPVNFSNQQWTERQRSLIWYLNDQHISWQDIQSPLSHFVMCFCLSLLLALRKHVGIQMAKRKPNPTLLATLQPKHQHVAVLTRSVWRTDSA